MMLDFLLNNDFKAQNISTLVCHVAYRHGYMKNKILELFDNLESIIYENITTK